MKYGFWLVALLFAAILQAILPTAVPFFGARLELLPVLAVFFALNLPVASALVWIFAAALVADTLSAMPFGLSVVPFCGVGAVLSAGREMIFREKIEAQAFVGGAATAAISTILWMLLRVMDAGPAFSWRVAAKIFFVGVMASAASPVVFFVMNKFSPRSEP
jgi:uncharacterized membrane protein YccF (DUF307 family)